MGWEEEKVAVVLPRLRVHAPSPPALFAELRETFHLVTDVSSKPHPSHYSFPLSL